MTATDAPRTWASPSSGRPPRFRGRQHQHPRLPWLQASPIRDPEKDSGRARAPQKKGGGYFYFVNNGGFKHGKDVELFD